MANIDFTANFREGSTDFSKKEIIRIKTSANAIKLDEAAPLVIDPEAWAIVDIHNEKAKPNKDYTRYVIIDKEGQLYVTGSDSFWRSFVDIWNEMEGETEPWSINVFKRDSNNYVGKQFLSCEII